MERLPTSASRGGTVFTIADFLEAGRARLSLSVLAGEERMGRVIEEPILNRPGLALTGFYKDFESRRIQVMGNAEVSYMESLPHDERVKRIRGFMTYRPALIVFTNDRKPMPESVPIAEEHGTVIMSTPLSTRRFTHHSYFILDHLAAPKTTIYGTMIEVCGLGVLLESDPGIGKSETALGLLRRGAALIADDLTCIRKDSAISELYGSASSSTAGFMERRGIGIIHVPSIFGVDAVRGEKRLQLVITLKSFEEIRSEVDRIGQMRHSREILGVKVPNIIIPVSEGRDLVNLVETAAQQYKLILSGRDPAAQLSMRLRSRADGTQLPNLISTI